MGLATHLLAVCLFYAVCRRFMNPRIALVLALLMGAFPWGIEAVMWLAAQQYIPGTALFWGNLLILLVSLDRQWPQWVTALICFIVTLLALFISEAHTFAFAASGAILWIGRGVNGWRDVMRRMFHAYAGWAPLAGAALYSFVQVMLQSSGHPVRFSIAAALRAIYMEYANAYVFIHWLCAHARRRMFFGWDILMTMAVILSIVVMVYLVFLLRPRNATVAPPPQSPPRFPPTWILIVWALALIFCDAAIYTFLGEFNPVSRRRYAIVPFFLFLLGVLWHRWRPQGPPESAWFPGFVLALVLLGAGTTWLNVGLWRYEERQYTALIDFLRDNKVTGEIHLVTDPEPKQYVGLCRRTRMLQFGAIHINVGHLRHLTPDQITLTTDPTAAPTLRYDHTQLRWSMDRANVGAVPISDR
jgi:hypothetical protein